MLKNKRRNFALAFLVTLLAAATTFAAGNHDQNKQQKNKKDQNVNVAAAMPQSIPDQLDREIGMMLGAWQVGDVEAMHKYYAEDATWVSGAYAPPIVGWKNYVASYEESRKGLTSGQLVRRNTNIFHYQDTAWASYQWEYDGIVNGQAIHARGQTTLVFVKQNGQWLIVHNHTSEICPR